MTSPLSRAEQAVAEAREAAFRERTLPSLDRLIRAVRKHDAEQVQANGWFVAASVITPADACQFHSPTGSPCDCGHPGAADCHPGVGRAT